MLDCDTYIDNEDEKKKIDISEFNKLNKHYNQTKMGIYQENCGLNNVKCSFGHDEYLRFIIYFTYHQSNSSITFLHFIYPRCPCLSPNGSLHSSQSPEP